MCDRSCSDALIYQRRLLEADRAREAAERERVRAIEAARRAERAAREAAVRLRELERAAENRSGCGVIPAAPYPPPLYSSARYSALLDRSNDVLYPGDTGCSACRRH